MASSQFPNYLRAHRKRLGLSQEEVAFLLGAENGSKVCRYERFTREPALHTALAYEAVFQRPLRELFEGLYKQIEKDVAARAKTLSGKKSGKSKRLVAHKQETLTKIAAIEKSS